MDTSASEPPTEIGIAHDADVQPWWLYTGTGRRLPLSERDRSWPSPPAWRRFSGGPDLPPAPADEHIRRVLGDYMEDCTPQAIDADLVSRVNAALYLRRPLLVYGEPGVGKTTLAYRIAYELSLGRVLRWRVTSWTTLAHGLYHQDGIGSPHAGQPADPPLPPAIVRLGPVGTALLPQLVPRMLLIEDLDRADSDLPDDLPALIDDGEFFIPGLAASRDTEVRVTTADDAVTAVVRGGAVRCHEFPVIVITTTGCRDLPAALVRRCISVRLAAPSTDQLADILNAHFPRGDDDVPATVLRSLLERAASDSHPSVDRLFNALHLVRSGILPVRGISGPEAHERAMDAVWRWAAVEEP